MRRLRIPYVVALVLLSSTKLSAQIDCDYSKQTYHWLIAGKAADGYWVRFSDPAYVKKLLSYDASERAYAARNLVPPGRDTIFDPVEYLAREAHAGVAYVAGRDARQPLPLDGVWRGADPLSCLKSFAQAAGLEVVAPQPDLWIIGKAEDVDRAAFVAYAYPLDPEGEGWQSEEQVGDIERALLAQLPIRDLDPSLRPHWIGLGYCAVPGERGTFLVVVTGPQHAEWGRVVVAARAYKVRVEREAGKVRIACIWGSAPAGELLPRLVEDLDGDGVRDFVFASGPYVGAADDRDVILSGSDGRVLARFRSEYLAVEKGASGAKRLGVHYADPPSGEGAVLRYEEKERRFAVVRREPAQPSTADQAPAGRLTDTWSWEEGHQLLAQEVGGADKVRVYFLPDIGFEDWIRHDPKLVHDKPAPPGMEGVTLRPSEVWTKLISWPEMPDLESMPAGLPVRVIYSYFSAGYVSELKERIGARPQQR